MPRQVHVIFEFKVRLQGKVWHYRGIEAMDGSYQMQRRGQHGTRFKTYMSTGLKFDIAHETEIVCRQPGAVRTLGPIVYGFSGESV